MFIVLVSCSACLSVALCNRFFIGWNRVYFRGCVQTPSTLPPRLLPGSSVILAFAAHLWQYLHASEWYYTAINFSNFEEKSYVAASHFENISLWSVKLVRIF